MKNLVACILCTTLPSAFAGPPDRIECRTQVGPALERLLARDERENPFVVVEHHATGQFVQYAVDEDGLFIDVPTMSLSTDEYRRVAAIFAENGIREPNVVSAQNVKTREDFTISAFQLVFGTKAVPAGSFGCRVLEEALLVPAGTSFMITEAEE